MIKNRHQGPEPIRGHTLAHGNSRPRAYSHRIQPAPGECNCYVQRGFVPELSLLPSSFCISNPFPLPVCPYGPQFGNFIIIYRCAPIWEFSAASWAPGSLRLIALNCGQ